MAPKPKRPEPLPEADGLDALLHALKQVRGAARPTSSTRSTNRWSSDAEPGAALTAGFG